MGDAGPHEQSSDCSPTCAVTWIPPPQQINKMVKTKQSKIKTKKSLSVRRRPKTRRRAPMDSYASRYLNLLRDPCGGELISPPYAGTDAGYIVRTTDILTFSATGAGMTVGSAVACNAVVAYSPLNVTGNTTNAAWIGAAQAPGGSGTPIISGAIAGGFLNTNVQNFITTTATVIRYRPVACCLKWVPIGAYAARAGVVGLSYIPGTPYQGAVSLPSYQAPLAASQHTSPNGSEQHEVRWLPTASDETWTFAGNGSQIVGAGTVQLTLNGVDGVATSATVAVPSGYIEATTVWEWIPNESQGLTLNPRVPVPFTTQGLLSNIRDLGSFLFSSMGSNMGMGGSGSLSRSVMAAVKGGVKLLSGGYGQIQDRGPTMLISY